MSKLNWKIIGRRVAPGDKLGMEYVDVEWTHDDGPVSDHVLLPMNHPPMHPLMGNREVQYVSVESGKRDIIKDCLMVKVGTPDSIVAMMLEEKRNRLAENLNIEP